MYTKHMQNNFRPQSSGMEGTPTNNTNQNYVGSDTNGSNDPFSPTFSPDNSAGGTNSIAPDPMPNQSYDPLNQTTPQATMTTPVEPSVTAQQTNQLIDGLAQIGATPTTTTPDANTTAMPQDPVINQAPAVTNATPNEPQRTLALDQAPSANEQPLPNMININDGQKPKKFPLRIISVIVAAFILVAGITTFLLATGTPTNAVKGAFMAAAGKTSGAFDYTANVMGSSSLRSKISGKIAFKNSDFLIAGSPQIALGDSTASDMIELGNFNAMFTIDGLFVRLALSDNFTKTMLGSMFGQVIDTKEINNQWYHIGESGVMGLDIPDKHCIDILRTEVSKTDNKRDIINLLFNTGLLKVKESGKDKDGKIYEVNMDISKYGDFANKLADTNFVKTIDQCSFEGQPKGSTAKKLKDPDNAKAIMKYQKSSKNKFALKVWIKGFLHKSISKISIQDNDVDAVLTPSKSIPEIKKPEGYKPISDLERDIKKALQRQSSPSINSSDSDSMFDADDSE